MWKFIRISVLLVILVCVTGMAWLERARSTSWRAPLWVGIFPMNADGSEVAERYIDSLKTEDFASLEDFFAREIHRYGRSIGRPIRVELYPPQKELPPALEAHSGPLSTAWWSLRMRWFAYRAANVPGRVPSHIRVFVLYHDPAINAHMPHSLGLQKGLIGVVHAFADWNMRGPNNIVIAHETMHTVGATDKYDPLSGLARYPAGYAEPDLTPLWPQKHAEIMAGQRMLSESESEMPAGLFDVVVGPQTAAEIGWSRK